MRTVAIIISIVSFLILVILVIYIVMIFKLRHKAKDLKNTVWDKQGYITTKEFSTLYIDDTKKAWYVIGCSRAYSYSDILDFSISENGTKYKLSGGAMRAVTGGILFGAVGAVVGAATAKTSSTVNSLTVDITVKDSTNPLVVMHLITQETSTSSIAYKGAIALAKRIVAELSMMKSSSQATQTSSFFPDNNISQDTNSNVINTKLVGVTKENDKGVSIQTILPTITEDSDLVLVREHGNEYDANAIKVVADHQHIGYLKSSIAQQLAPLMDQGEIIDVELSEITGGGKRYFGCNVRLTFNNKSPAGKECLL